MPDAKADKTPPRSAYGQYELLYDEEIDKERIQTEKTTRKSNKSASNRANRGPSSWK